MPFNLTVPHAMKPDSVLKFLWFHRGILICISSYLKKKKTRPSLNLQIPCKACKEGCWMCYYNTIWFQKFHWWNIWKTLIKWKVWVFWALRSARSGTRTLILRKIPVSLSLTDFKLYTKWFCGNFYDFCIMETLFNTRWVLVAP